MMEYGALKTLIEELGVHPALGPGGQGWGIEQNAHELATFLVALPPVEKALEIGSGHKAGLSRFMHAHLGWDVTSVDIRHYGHAFPGIRFLVADEPLDLEEAYDLVLIDGDHAYESVKADYKTYGDLAPVVMFHDICGLRDCEGVAKLWKEIAYTQKGNLRKVFHEAIADGDMRAGIGWRAK